MKPILLNHFLTAALSCGIARQALAQPATTPYTSSPTLQAETLDASRSKTLLEFLARPLKSQTKSALGGELCKAVVTKPTPASDQLKLALALVESDIVPILSLERPSTSSGQASTTITYSIEFGLDAVTLRSSNARYQSQANGLRVAYPSTTTLPVWFEGKDDTSILFLVPPVRDCNVQFVLACPRTYSKSRTLEVSPLTLTGVKYIPSSKADGIFKAPEGGEGKVMAAALASSRVQLPQPWSSVDVSAGSPSTSFKIRKPLDTLVSSTPFTSVSLPIVDAVEARLEFGTPTSAQRVVRSRATLEISPFTIESTQPIRIERSDIPLSPGSCIVISRRGESHY